MIIDVSDVRGSSMTTMAYTASFAIVIILIVLIVVNRFLKPYVNIFYSIKDVMMSAYTGDYSKRVHGGALSDSKEVADMLNSLLEKLQNIFDEIDKKVCVFIQNKNQVQNSDPLININNTIDQLSEIYKFKQTIEHDENFEDIYERLAYVFINKFSIRDFSFIEADILSGVKKVVYSTNSCHCSVEEGSYRADRINMNVDSTNFDLTCKAYNEPDLEYLCDKESLKSIAEKIRVTFSKQIISAGAESFSKTLSVGAAMFPEDSDSIWKCIKFADMSLYHAKENGRNQVVIFDPSLLINSSVSDQF
ncbi:MAG: diguanylate cyclase [Campylobacterota bacterium]|nr:diguanylate cyclase [Campylobacterota bacterium]